LTTSPASGEPAQVRYTFISDYGAGVSGVHIAKPTQEAKGNDDAHPEATRLARSAAHWILATALPTAVLADEPGKTATIAAVRFNSDFLKRSDGTSVDVSRFALGNPISPGDHPVDIYLNGSWVGRETVRFRSRDEVVGPCMDRSLITRLNLDEQALPPVNRNAIAQAVSGECTRPSDISEDITWSFNLNDLRLDIGVAQALLRRTRAAASAQNSWMMASRPRRSPTISIRSTLLAAHLSLLPTLASIPD
jgi:outer membrane usher protein FimD/PapC